MENQTIPAHKSEFIVDGELAKISEAPWTVAIYSLNKNLSICGGAIISYYWVLSAAHCFCFKNGTKKVLEERLNIASGNEFYPNATMHEIETIMCHPNYRKNFSDIALVRVKKPFKFNDSVRKNIWCSPFSGEAFAGHEAIITGWGRIDYNATKRTKYLHRAILKISNSKEVADVWEKKYGLLINPQPDNIYGVAIDKGAACIGDSGSPLTIQNTLIGIASHIRTTDRFKCGRNILTVYIDVHYHIKWIKDTIQLFNKNRTRG